MSDQDSTRTREAFSVNKDRPKEPSPKRLRTFIKVRRDQPSVIWGGPGNERVIAKFSRKGVCRTRSPEIAERLAKMGYVEVQKGQTIVPTPFAEPDMSMAFSYDDDENAEDLGEIIEDVDG